MKHQRSLIIFHSAIKSEKTKTYYDLSLNQFREYYLIKDYDSLLTWDLNDLQTRIEDFIMYLRGENKSHSAINGMISSLKLFFSMNRIILNWVIIKKLLPEKKKTLYDKAYTTEQVNEILKHTVSLQYKAMIQFMASSGVRVGAFSELRIKDLEDFKDGCKSVKVYAGSNQEYFTFIHQEVVKALEEYFEYRRKNGEKLTLDSWVFQGKNTQGKPICSQTSSTSISRIVSKCDFRKKTDGRFDIMVCHGFRKRFATILKSNNEINLSISEKLLGHSTTVQLDNLYFKPTLEVLFDEYRKAIPDLSLDQSVKLKLELEKKNNQLSSLEVKDRRIEYLENALAGIQLNMNELNSKIT